MQRRYNIQTESWYNYYYVQDGLGHTRLLLDGNGNVKNRYAYDAWGNLIEYVENVPNPFTWNGAYGYEYIPLTGLYHVGAREYDPRTGRWLQRDPIEASSGDPHFWRYCGNDPLNGVDPSGLDGWLHTVLDAAGFVPGIGELADAANALLYLAEGDLMNAGISAASAFGGDILKLGRAGVRAMDTAQTALKETAQQGTQQAVKKEAKQATTQQAQRVTGEELKRLRKEFDQVVKPAFWKNEAKKNPGKYSPEDLEKMKKGRPPIGSDGKPMELHHKKSLNEGGSNCFDNLEIMTFTEHRSKGNFKKNHPNLGKRK
jgi:RHS repeat-associated protein